MIALWLAVTVCWAQAWGEITGVQTALFRALEPDFGDVPAEVAHVERRGEPLTVRRGLKVRVGDRVVTREATVEITTPDGFRFRVGTHTDGLVVGANPLHRVGRMVYAMTGPFRLQSEDLALVVRGTEFEVRRNDQRQLVVVTEGVVEVTDPATGTTVVVRAGARGRRVVFTDGGPFTATPCAWPHARRTVDEVPGTPRALLPCEARRFRRAEARDFTRTWHRLHVQLEQGAALAGGFAWSDTALAARVRLVGPLWIEGSVGRMVRRQAVLERVAWYGAWPLRLGPKLMFDIGRGFYVGGTGSVAAVTSTVHCTGSTQASPCVESPVDETKTVVFWGGTGELAAGLYITELVGVELGVDGGAHAGAEGVEWAPLGRASVAGFVRW